MKIKENSAAGRLLLFAAGIAGSAIINESFDWFVFPIVMSWFGLAGLWKSFIILYLSALVLNYILIKVYDVFKKDLFGFEDIKKTKASDMDPEMMKKWKFRMMVRLNKHQKTLFVFLSLWDPFLATLYTRDTSTFNGFSMKDYAMLCLSTFIGCFFWMILFSPSLLIDLQSIVKDIF